MPVNQGDRVCLKCGGVNGHDITCTGGDDQVFEVISAYSRAQAIADGVLVDCSQAPFDQINLSAGIKVHVAMTAEAFHAYVHPIGLAASPMQAIQNGNRWQLNTRSINTEQLPSGQDMVGRYWDIIWMLQATMQHQKDVAEVLFRFGVVPNSGGNPEMVELKCVAGPDDDGELCLTIMLPDQD